MRKLLRFIFLLFFALIISRTDAEVGNLKTTMSPKKTICLNMIVKDESKVIKRCLESVKKIIDYWVIVDTGSTDGTQQIIKEFMKDIPGELHERPWINFGQNRNEALQLAKNKGDYLLFIDADEYLIFEEYFKMPFFDKDLYLVIVRENCGGTVNDFKRNFLINNHLEWRWVGPIHEQLECRQPISCDLLSKVINYTMYDGHRNEDPKKDYKDALLIENLLKDDPQNTRYCFYLAQAYFSAKEYKLALKNYEKRAQMKGGWDIEIFWSLYQIGILQEMLEMNEKTIIDSYYKAFQFRPSRAEPLYRLGRFYNKNNNYKLAYIVLKSAMFIPLTQDFGGIEKWIYDYGICYEFFNACYNLNKFDEAKDCLSKLKRKNLDKDLQIDIEKKMKTMQTKGVNI
ncbi:MAG: glycosyltransferase [Chlamydiae bacterium]|nr:glycosyltransferase [Chlamydiota bacterium]